MRSRNQIIQTIGAKFLSTNIENDEFSYQKEFARLGLDFDEIKIKSDNGSFYKNLDIRFIDEKNKFVILVETKQEFSKEKDSKQLEAYMFYEKKISPSFEILGILANTKDERICVYKNSLENELPKEVVLKSFEEYKDLIKPKLINNRESVMKNTYDLNELLHKFGINEKIRGQFVGTCLLALKNHLVYNGLATTQIIAGIRDILSSLLNNDLNRANKLSVIDSKVLDSQDIRELPKENFITILKTIEEKIYPHINDKSTMGQDLLNLFFTIFNKYVGKSDKNQAFTPDHIVEFMCKVVGINKNTRVLDPCCGSGSFLVRALTDELDKCDSEEERKLVKKEHIYGIEFDETAFGLSTTNMLIHGDGNSNIVQGSCFDRFDRIKEANIDVVLMNPPYNAQAKHCSPNYTKTWNKDLKQDPSKGFHFVYEIANQIASSKARLAVLLPMQCAIGTGSEIQKFKELMLQKHHLDAVFSLPSDIFHPGASACACCMIFDLNTKHEDALNKDTFFGYFKDDGFKKKKNLGRVERKEGIWKNEILPKWIDLYVKRKSVPGLSVVKHVGYKDEWLAEAYMETDYTNLTEADFQKTINDYLAYLIKEGDVYEA